MKATELQENWHILYTYPNSEKKIYCELGRRNITAFLPIQTITRQWSDRKKNVEIPLFPNYVFVKVVSKAIWEVLMITGIVKFVSYNGRPAIIKEEEIDSVKKILMGNDLLVDKNPFISGDRVKVKDGVLSGLVGKILYKKGTSRLYVELSAINQVISVEIDASLVEKLS